jgi:hypothetical protein
MDVVRPSLDGAKKPKINHLLATPVDVNARRQESTPAQARALPEVWSFNIGTGINAPLVP